MKGDASFDHRRKEAESEEERKKRI